MPRYWYSTPMNRKHTILLSLIIGLLSLPVDAADTRITFIHLNDLHAHLTPHLDRVPDAPPGQVARGTGVVERGGAGAHRHDDQAHARRGATQLPDEYRRYLSRRRRGHVYPGQCHRRPGQRTRHRRRRARQLGLRLWPGRVPAPLQRSADGALHAQYANPRDQATQLPQPGRQPDPDHAAAPAPARPCCRRPWCARPAASRSASSASPRTSWR
ncbi:MAG: hypothetical protein MZU95_10475 [Desulfomicrobium escambiense]|nr:hypothetical protein [Desulfomicrobium escambiense]